MYIFNSHMKMTSGRPKRGFESKNQNDLFLTVNPLRDPRPNWDPLNSIVSTSASPKTVGQTHLTFCRMFVASERVKKLLIFCWKIHAQRYVVIFPTTKTKTSGLGFRTMKTKGLITWWISARAEISLLPPGWNIVAITWSISARAQNANFREKVYWGAKTQ